MLKRFKDFLAEDHDQLEIPFDRKAKTKKPLHVDFMDALEDLAKSVRPFQSDKSPDDYLDAAIEGLDIKEYIDDDTSATGIMFYIINQLGIEALTEEFRKEHEINGPGDLDSGQISGNDSDIFTPEAIEFMKTNKEEIIADRDEFDMRWTVKDAYDKSDDGLIPVWRAMAINEDFVKENKAKSLYDLMVKKLKGAGQYWSWSKDAAHAHWGNHGYTLDVLLEGRVRAQDVSWERTLGVSIYDLNEEKEITISGMVKIVSVEFNKNDDEERSKLLSSHTENLDLIVPTGTGTR